MAIHQLRIVRFEDTDKSFIVHGKIENVEAYMKDIYEQEGEEILSESENSYLSLDELERDLLIVQEDNPSFAVDDADYWKSA